MMPAFEAFMVAVWVYTCAVSLLVPRINRVSYNYGNAGDVATVKKRKEHEDLLDWHAW